MYRSYIPKNQRSTIQNYLYPKITSKMDFNAHLANISRIHKYEEKNKQNELIDKINEEEKQKKEGKYIFQYLLDHNIDIYLHYHNKNKNFFLFEFFHLVTLVF